MPIIKKILNNFIKQYGKKEGIRRYFAWEKANPKQYKKALRTARKKGDKIIKSLSVKKYGKKKKKSKKKK